MWKKNNTFYHSPVSDAFILALFLSTIKNKDLKMGYDTQPAKKTCSSPFKDTPNLNHFAISNKATHNL